MPDLPKNRISFEVLRYDKDNGEGYRRNSWNEIKFLSKNISYANCFYILKFWEAFSTLFRSCCQAWKILLQIKLYIFSCFVATFIFGCAPICIWINTSQLSDDFVIWSCFILSTYTRSISLPMSRNRKVSWSFFSLFLNWLFLALLFYLLWTKNKNWMSAFRLLLFPFIE